MLPISGPRSDLKPMSTKKYDAGRSGRAATPTSAQNNAECGTSREIVAEEDDWADYNSEADSQIRQRDGRYKPYQELGGHVTVPGRVASGNNEDGNISEAAISYSNAPNEESSCERRAVEHQPCQELGSPYAAPKRVRLSELYVIQSPPERYVSDATQALAPRAEPQVESAEVSTERRRMATVARQHWDEPYVAPPRRHILDEQDFIRPPATYTYGTPKESTYSNSRQHDISIRRELEESAVQRNVEIYRAPAEVAYDANEPVLHRRGRERRVLESMKERYRPINEEVYEIRDTLSRGREIEIAKQRELQDRASEQRSIRTLLEWKMTRDEVRRTPNINIANFPARRYEPPNPPIYDADINEALDSMKPGSHKSPYTILSNVAEDNSLQINYHVRVPIMYADEGSNAAKNATATAAAHNIQHQEDQPVPSLPPHKYSVLPGPGWIRVLRIEPGNSDETIRCQLISQDLDGSSSAFNALSYHWGSTDFSYNGRTIVCDGRRKDITFNLFEALKAVRHSTDSVLLWADAICINQEDTSERNHQVSLMQRIYKQASKVIVWIGNNIDASEIVLALDLVCNLANRYPPATRATTDEAAYEFQGQLISNRSRPNDKLPYHDAEDWKMVAKLFDQHWFWRVWVIQETVLASSVIVRWGAATIDYRWIGLAAAWIRTNEAKFLEKYPATGVYNAYLMYRLRMADWKMTLIQLLQHTRQFEVTDPRDRVYGLLGLPATDCYPLNGKLYIEPDYNLDCYQVYTALATKALCERKDLSILSSVQHGPHDLQNQSLASWVPDWNLCEGHSLAPPHSHPPHRTSSGIEPDVCLTGKSIHEQAVVYYDVSNSNEYPVLRIKGIQIGVIEHCMQPCIKTLSRENRAEIISDSLRELIFNYKCPEETLAWTITAGKNWYGTLISDAEDHLEQFRALVDALDTDHIFMKNYKTASTVERPEDASLSESNPKISSISVEKFVDAAARACITRRFFWTADGSLGLGPTILHEGDLICILFGGHMPYVLRPDGEGRYRFLGECYVYDFMDGQAAEEWEKSGQPATHFDIY